MTEKSRKRNSNVKLEQRNPPVSKKTKDSQNGASLLGCLNSEQIQERISLIDQGFYLKCPPDFLSFYEFCKTLSNDAPLDALSEIGFRLVGPFEILHYGSKDQVKKGQWSNHYRFYHDPPEFVTVVVCSNDQSHIGYFRDSYESTPFVAKSTATISGVIEYCGQNLFAFLRTVLDRKTSCHTSHLLESFDEFVSAKNILIDDSSSFIKHRKKHQVCATTNSIGLMIDVSEGDIGYRPISVSYSELNSRLQSIVNANSNEAQLAKFIPLDELITYANFANDEGDFGQGLELGLSLLAFHPKARPLKSADVLNNKIKHLLSVGYKLAKKNEFSQVIEAHMDDRRIEPLTFT
uniref:Uncharacterized protein n=1 Tax=Trichobilharzia regenti TaxID=157069 RepID=A0AA85JR19_TRIRE|nr:unnamed protein product [Trichobilharzia regenti]